MAPTGLGTASTPGRAWGPNTLRLLRSRPCRSRQQTPPPGGALGDGGAPAVPMSASTNEAPGTGSRGGARERCFSVPFRLQAELSILILCFHARSSERQTPLLGGPGEEWESGNVGPGWGGRVELLTGGSRHPGGQDTGSGIASRFLNCSLVLRKARDAAHLFRRKCAALGPSPGRRHMGVSWPLGEAPGLAPPSPELPGRPSLHAQGDAPGGPEGVRPPRVRGRRWWLPLTRPPGTSAQ